MPGSLAILKIAVGWAKRQRAQQTESLCWARRYRAFAQPSAALTQPTRLRRSIGDDQLRNSKPAFFFAINQLFIFNRRDQ